MSRDLEALQGRILARVCRFSGGEVLDREISAVVGRCRSWVSKVRSGERELVLSQLIKLIRRYGAVAVLEPLARLDNCTVVEVDGTPARDVVGQALRTAVLSTTLAEFLRQALADNIITEAEREGLLALLEELIASGRASVPATGRVCTA